MSLVLILVIPFISGFFAWYISRFSEEWARWTSLAGLIADLILIVFLWDRFFVPATGAGYGIWFAEVKGVWIPQVGIGFHLAADGLSLLMVLLTIFLGIMSVGISWNEIREKVGFFHLNLMLILTGILGVFLSVDLFLFYFFWELMLIPMYFLIRIWGHENRIYAAVKFFIFTQLSGLLMLLSILGLYFIHGFNTGTYTFDYEQLLGTTFSPFTGMWLMLGFLAAFGVKLPIVPFHTWLPDAHTEAPTAGSVVLAGLLLKTGAYGMLRFLIPLFPVASAQIAPFAMAIGVIGILYGAVLAFAQTDLKRLVAYTSVSHMGFVFLGIYAWNGPSLQGVVMQMLSHGVSTGALFMLVGALQERIKTRSINLMGGLWSDVPKMGAMVLLFALASLGLPGMGNFVAEFLVLLGVYMVSVPPAALAATGLVLATVYALWIVHRVFHGPQKVERQIADLSAREVTLMASLVVVILWLGLFPRPFLDTAGPSLEVLRKSGLTAPLTMKHEESISAAYSVVPADGKSLFSEDVRHVRAASEKVPNKPKVGRREKNTPLHNAARGDGQ